MPAPLRLAIALACLVPLRLLAAPPPAPPANPAAAQHLPPPMAPLSYPPARRSDHVDTYFNTPVPDPYRWMEDVDSAEVKQWVDAENTLTRSVLDPLPGRDAMHARLSALYNFERFSSPEIRHHDGVDRLFYTHNSGLQNQPVLLWQDGLNGTPHTLLDPNTLSPDGTVALSTAEFSNDGALMAYALADAGSDWITWHVRRVDTGQDLPDTIRWSKFSGASWLHDNSGFFYSGYGLPASGAAAPGNDAESLKQAQFGHKLFFHRLGTPQTADPVVFDVPSDKEMLVGGHVTDDGLYLLLSASKGHTNTLAALALRETDLRHLDLAHPDRSHLIAIAPAPDARYIPVETDGDTLWLHTTSHAPNGTVVAVDLQHPDRAAWKPVLPETHNNLDAIRMVDNTFIANYLADAQSLVELHDRSGKLLQAVTLPAIGTATDFTGRRTDRQSFFTFTNFTTPGTVLRLDLANRSLSTYRAPKLTFNPADFETHEVFVTSKDGTKVPLFLTGKRGLPRDGSTPTILYAYGGFDISLLPQFVPNYLLWMEMGGLYAQASLRGGGEYGESWHEAGTKLGKQNVFDDFIACAEFLSREHYTSPAKLAIEGGSNGGLLIGAVEEQRPELFGAALAHVGVMDMLRFDQFTIGYAWRSDYGSPSANEADFHNLRKFSPVHNVRPGLKYPPTLVFTADHDDRVFPAHSFKFTAAMQHALTEDAAQNPPLHAGPVLIRIETRAGHGGGMPLSKRIEMTVDSYSFLSRFLNTPLNPTPTPR